MHRKRRVKTLPRIVTGNVEEGHLTEEALVRRLKDGVRYQLLGFDLNLGAEEMFDMAEEIIGTK